MKQKILLSLAAWLICMSYALADNYVINPVTIPQGSEVKVPIGYLFDSGKTFVGFQLSIGLPEGLSTIKDEDSLPVYEVDANSLGTSFNITATVDNSFAAIPKATTTTIQGTSGTLITITIAADASLEVGSKLTVSVTNAMFTSKDASDNLASGDVPDFTFEITIGEPDDGYIKFNETAIKLPEYTAGGKGNVRMTRTIKKDQWNTIVLPFTLTKAKAEAVFGSDVELAEFAGFEVDYGDDDENVVPLGITINFSTYTLGAKKPLTGGKPFLIKTSKDITSFEAEDCSLVDAVTDVTKTDEFDTSGKFTGSFVKTKVPADDLFISDNKFYYSTGATNIKAFRGWFELGAVLDKETDFSVKMFIDGAETKVDGLSMKDATGTIYDISGRKIEKPQQRGIYIVNGKKMLKN